MPALVASLSACTNGDGLPWAPVLPPAQPPIAQPTPDLAPPAPSVADLASPDLLPPPQTIRFSIAQLTGTGISGDTTMVSFPLPAPTSVPVDGIGYLYAGFRDGQYDLTLEWLDKRDDNLGWTASFGGAPGITSGWPLMSRRITMTAGATEFGPDKVAIIGAAGAQPNTLIITIRSVSDPQNDYGILRQGVKGR